MLIGSITFLSYADLLIFVSTLAAVASGLYFRKQTVIMQKQLTLAQDKSNDDKSISEKSQSRVNDEIIGYSASPGVLRKMGLSERVELLSDKAIQLDKKTDLQNLVINDMATTVKQLLPNGGSSIADKIDNLTQSISSLSVQLTDNSDKFATHLISSEITRHELADRISSIENQIHKQDKRLEMPNGFTES